MHNTLSSLATQLDSRNLAERLAALSALRDAEARGDLAPASPKIGPALPSYVHVHTNASYGFDSPGVFSVARMVWAAHEARADAALMVEHESLAHMDEAAQAVAIVNRGAQPLLRLILAVEFKAPIALRDAASRQLSEQILKVWGQGESAWVVAVAARHTPELDQLVRLFQQAKRTRAEQQLAKLNQCLRLKWTVRLDNLLTPDGNVTDRQLSLAVAKAELGDVDEVTLARRGSEIRKMLNPGREAYAPFPPGLPDYQDLVGQLARWGTVPTFTAQLRGQALAGSLPALKSWGMGGLDVAGVEPYEPNAERDIAEFIELARKHDMLLFGGSDYRGTGTGWSRHAAWMDHPLLRASLDRVAREGRPA
jgi:hypothetical protein